MTRNHWEIITTIVRLSNTIEPLLVKHLSTYGLGLTDLRLLSIIRLHGGIAQKTLAAKTGLSQGVVSSRLDRMEQFGWVSRQHAGRRLVALELTPAGGKLLSLILNSLEESAPIQSMQGLSDREATALVQRLRRLVQVMGNQTDGTPAGVPDTVSPAPMASVTQRLVTSRDALEHALEAGGYELTEAVRRLEDELDDLLRAYMLLNKGRDGSAEG